MNDDPTAGNNPTYGARFNYWLGTRDTGDA